MSLCRYLRNVKLILSAILTPIFFLVFGLILVLFHPIQVIARNVLGPKAHDKTVFALNLFLMRALHILGVRYSFHNFKFIKLHMGHWMLIHRPILLYLNG